MAANPAYSDKRDKKKEVHKEGEKPEKEGKT